MPPVQNLLSQEECKQLIKAEIQERYRNTLDTAAYRPEKYWLARSEGTAEVPAVPRVTWGTPHGRAEGTSCCSVHPLLHSPSPHSGRDPPWASTLVALLWPYVPNPAPRLFLSQGCLQVPRVLSLLGP